jgi:integrase
MPLSTKAIDKLVREAKAGRFPKTAVHDEHGLYLSRDLNSWLQRVTVGGKRRWMGLGALSSVSLADARELGRKARGLAAAGADPIQARKVERAASVVLSVKTAAENFYAAHGAGWRSDKTRVLFRQVMADHVCPKLGQRGVATITALDVMSVLKPLWDAKQVATGMRAQTWLARIFNATRGDLGGLSEEARNPAEWDRLRDKLGSPYKIRPAVHHPAMPWQDVPGFMARLRDIDGLTARSLEFTMLTAVRLYPVRAMQWREVDLDAATWTIPGHKEKSGVEHRVPLSQRALENLRAIRPVDARPDDVVFHGIKGRRAMQCDMNCAELMRRMGVHGVTVHGFRSSFRDWAGETTGHDADICEAALSHKFGGTRGSYQRGGLFSKRQVLMNDWDRYCSGVVEMKRAA